jgi:hypothetical protein
MNPLHDTVITGTTGELLVQLRLFQFGVQAAPPLKDSGNDLIAVHGDTFRAIQVKTTGNEDGRWKEPNNKYYHILALVRLRGSDDNILLDQSDIFLINRSEVELEDFSINRPEEQHRISQKLVDSLIPK